MPRASEVGCNDAIRGQVFNGGGKGEGLGLAFCGEADISLTLQAPLGVPFGLAVANEQQPLHDRRSPLWAQSAAGIWGNPKCTLSPTVRCGALSTTAVIR